MADSKRQARGYQDLEFDSAAAARGRR